MGNQCRATTLKEFLQTRQRRRLDPQRNLKRVQNQLHLTEQKRPNDSLFLSRSPLLWRAGIHCKQAMHRFTRPSNLSTMINNLRKK